MAISIKNNDEIQKMRVACKITAETLQYVEGLIKPGITTGEIDRLAEEFIRSKGAVPNFKNYNGFKGSVCASVNEVVIHGIPGIKVLKEGDIISIDTGAKIDGFNGDAARTFLVGHVSHDIRHLVEVTQQSFFEGIRYAREGCHLHEISAAIENHVVSNGFTVVRDFVGHGVGRDLHEAPEIPNYKPRSRGPRLQRGMCLAIEPMVNMGVADVTILKDGWTVITDDGKCSAHYENTVLITDGEPEILTIY